MLKHTIASAAAVAIIAAGATAAPAQAADFNPGSQISTSGVKKGVGLPTRCSVIIKFGSKKRQIITASLKYTGSGNKGVWTMTAPYTTAVSGTKYKVRAINPIYHRGYVFSNKTKVEIKINSKGKAASNISGYTRQKGFVQARFIVLKPNGKPFTTVNKKTKKAQTAVWSCDMAA